MATNQDIMAFLMAEKEARAREKEEERLARAKERQEDMEQIKVLIVSGVKEEVQEAVEPLKERLQLQEKETSELKQQFSDVMKEVQALKSTNSDHFPALPTFQSGSLNSLFRVNSTQRKENSNRVARDDDHARQVQDLCADARKVIGLTPIEPRMLQIQIESYGAKDHDEAMIMEVKSYLKCEMKMYPSEIDKLQIVKIFAPHGQEEWNTLFVEFGSEYQVDKVLQHTKYMSKRDHRVVHWFPTQMKERRKAIEKIAFEIRDAGRAHKVRTRVRVGREDIELSTRLPSGRWIRELLPTDLPAIDLFYSSGPVQTSSPPPGRPGREAMPSGKRPMSADSDVDDDASKKHKGDSQVDDKEVEKHTEDMIEENSGVPAVDDMGKFISQEAYSPLTPAKAKSIPDLSVLLNSPVYHTKLGKK